MQVRELLGSGGDEDIEIIDSSLQSGNDFLQRAGRLLDDLVRPD